MKAYQAILLVLAASLTGLAGCGPVRLVATTNIPQPLVLKLPVGVALFIPMEFAQYVHHEERWSTDWEIDVGKAQTDGMKRLLNAMFERVIPVDSVNAGAQVPQISAILEPSIEEYAFVTPRDAGSPFFAVSIKYRVNVYLPDGKLADSWGFTGYGTAPAQGLSSTKPLADATSLAMRDAGAKLAVEFREQAIVRGLLPGAESADTTSATDPIESEAANVPESGDETDPDPQTEAPTEPAPASDAPGAGDLEEPVEDDESEAIEEDDEGEEAEEDESGAAPELNLEPWNASSG